jgi:hypothetical protein
MLLPDPRFVLVLIGNALVVLFNLLCVKRKRAWAASVAEPFSDKNPTGRACTVLFRRRTDAYQGAIMAVVLTALAGFIFLPDGLDVWDPGYLTFWSDPEVLFIFALTMAFFVLPGVVDVLFYSGLSFILTEEGVSRTRGRKQAHMAWTDITDITRYAGDGDQGIVLHAGKDEMQIPERLTEPLAFYAQAVRKLPEGLHQNEAFLWMESMVSGRGQGSAASRRSNGKRLLGATALLLCWTPLLASDLVGMILAIVLMLVLIILGVMLLAKVEGEKFRFQRTFDGLDQRQAVRAATAWLQGQAATDIVADENGVRAVHGSRKVISVWKPGAFKSVLVRCKANGGRTVVDAELTVGSALYADDVRSFHQEIVNGWGGWLEGLWKEMEKVSTGPQAPSAQASTGIGPLTCPREK